MLEDMRTLDLFARITEFPDGSRIFQSEGSEMLLDIARVLGFEVEAFLSANLVNYPNLRKDTILEKGTIFELPSAPNTGQDDGPVTSGVFLSGMSTAVHVFGSGDNVGKRTEGLLQAKDKNKSYVVLCSGREMKLSEFCQLAGNKKNRPRECIMISLTDEPLIDYEARITNGTSHSANHQNGNFGPQQHHSSVFKILDRQEASDPSVDLRIHIPEPGTLISLTSPGKFRGDVGLITSRDPGGIYKVTLLKATRSVIGIALRTLEFGKRVSVRRHQFCSVSPAEQLHHLEQWCISMQSLLNSMSSLPDLSAVLKNAMGDFSDSLCTMRLAVMKQVSGQISPQLNLLVATNSHEGWRAVGDGLQRLNKNVAFSSSVVQFVRIMELTSTLSSQNKVATPRTTEDHKSTSAEAVLNSEANEVSCANDQDDACSDEDNLASLMHKEEQLAERLKELEVRLGNENKRRRALIRKQDTTFDSISEALHGLEEQLIQDERAKSMLSKECALLLHVLHFLESSKLAMEFLRFDGLVTPFERAVKERASHLEMLKAVANILKNLQGLKTQENANVRMDEFIVGLKLEFETMLQRERKVLCTAYRIREFLQQFKIRKMAYNSHMEQSASSNRNSVRQKAHEQRSVRSIGSTKHYHMLRAEKLTAHSIHLKFITRLPVSPDKFEVAWENVSDRRGESFLPMSVRTSEKFHVLSGLTPSTQYRFRFRYGFGDSWSDWSEAATFKTLEASEESLVGQVIVVVQSPNADSMSTISASDSVSLAPFVFLPLVAESPGRERTPSPSTVSWSWCNLIDKQFVDLDNLISALITSIEQCLTELGLDAKVSFVQADQNLSQAAYDINAARTDSDKACMEESSYCSDDEDPVGTGGVQRESENNFLRSRARTKADLRLGAVRTLSNPHPLSIACDPGNRDAKRARMTESPVPSDSFSHTPLPASTLQQDTVDDELSGNNVGGMGRAQELDLGESKANHQAESRQRQELSVKLAARLRAGNLLPCHRSCEASNVHTGQYISEARPAWRRTSVLHSEKYEQDKEEASHSHAIVLPALEGDVDTYASPDAQLVEDISVQCNIVSAAPKKESHRTTPMKLPLMNTALNHGDEEANHDQAERTANFKLNHGSANKLEKAQGLSPRDQEADSMSEIDKYPADEEVEDSGQQPAGMKGEKRGDHVAVKGDNQDFRQTVGRTEGVSSTYRTS